MATGKAPQSHVCVGEITAPHGVRGLVRVRSFTDDPEALFAYPLQKDDGSAVPMKKQGVLKDFFFAVVDGVDTVEKAQAWRGTKLYTDRAHLPATVEDQYYLADLKGLTAMVDGQAIGTVDEIYDFGAGTILEIKCKGAPALMLPFTDDFVPQVNIAEGTIDIVMPIEVDGEER